MPDEEEAATFKGRVEGLGNGVAVRARLMGQERDRAATVVVASCVPEQDFAILKSVHLRLRANSGATVCLIPLTLSF